MPEITVIHIAIVAGAVAVGAIAGWVVRANRCAQEKANVSEGWQQQLEGQRTEHERLLEQNKALMEKVSLSQATGNDASNRARELSSALKEAFSRRDELQKELREMRSNLEVAVRQRDKLHSDMRSTEVRGDSAQEALKERDEKIFRLSRELENWQNRLPPLLERYRDRDEEAVALEDELSAARDRIAELENLLNSEETRIEPVDPEALGDELDASNDPSSITQTGIADVLAEDDSDEELVPEDVEDESEEESEAVAEEEARGELDDDYDVEVGEYADDDSDDEAQEALDGDVVDEPEDVLEASADEDTADEADDESVEIEDEIEDAVAYSDSHVIDDADDEIRADEVETDADDDTGSVAISADITELYDREPGGVRDDLKLIKGVGPAIEKTLNELGIFRFHQIAEMSEYDIDRVARRLKGFRTRIYREDWIGQARDLLLQKSGT